MGEAFKVGMQPVEKHCGLAFQVQMNIVKGRFKLSQKPVCVGLSRLTHYKAI